MAILTRGVVSLHPTMEVEFQILWFTEPRSQGGTMTQVSPDHHHRPQGAGDREQDSKNLITKEVDGAEVLNVSQAHLCVVTLKDAWENQRGTPRSPSKGVGGRW